MQNNLYSLTLAHLIGLSEYNLNSNKTTKANALLVTPDPNQPISTQIDKTIIDNLPDPQTLRNRYFQMYIGPNHAPVQAKDDGTYCYGVRDPELAATSVFLSLNKQIELYLELGMKRPKRPLSVIIDNPFVVDNAVFDQKHFAIHIGVGTGINHRGLTRHIALDLGVANHEFGHAAMFLQTGMSDLPSKEGDAIHEGVADVLGTLVMDYLSRIQYAKKLGKSFTAIDLKNDLRIIGKYACPPFGMRSQKTNKKAPADIIGEPHADGMIVGSALADLLVEIASQQGTDLEKQLRLFIKITLLALALLPDLQIKFTDLLRTMIMADKQISGGKHRSLIEQCFATHGITFNTIASPFDVHSIPNFIR